MAKASKPKQPSETKKKAPPLPPSPNARPPGNEADDVVATPSIDTPLANSFAPAGVDVTINISTNRGDLRYVVEFADTNAPPSPIVMNAAAPGTNGIVAIVSGSNVTGNRVYRIRVSVDPGDGLTPPHFDHAINIHTTPPPGGVIIRGGRRQS